MYKKILLNYTDKPSPHRLAEYEAGGGYQALARALHDYTPDQLIQMVQESNLRGRGGAGFSAGLKWSFIPRDSKQEKYLCCNADEGEPGTFKDRELIDKVPHLLIEGMTITAYAIGAKKAFIYIRGEFSFWANRIEEALAEARQKGFIGRHILGTDFDLEFIVHHGAGAYICGEETALIESLEGDRGQPRYKPPFPALQGLYDCPTLVNNVETLCCIPSIIKNGAKWFKSIGPEDSPGPKLFCLSGHVRKPGVYELPMGISLRDLVEKYGEGTRSGKRIKAVIPGGVTAPMFPESQLDINMDFDSLAAAGSMLGSGAVIVMDETTCMVKVARRIMEFFYHESCGKCTPCREGLEWLVKILRRLEGGQGRSDDVQQLEELCTNIFGNTFCPLGDGAVMALRGALKHFPEEFSYHAEKRDCVVNSGVLG
jgi:NADH-quinone oxidoreductase subunit F